MMDLGEGGKYHHAVKFHLKPHHFKKYLKKEGFQMSPSDLENQEGNEVSMKVSPAFHRRYRHSMRHKKSLRVLKSDYDNHFIGHGEQMEEKKRHPRKKREKPAVIEEGQSKPSATPDHLLLPHGQLLRR